MKKGNQYTKVAREAYDSIVDKGIGFEEAWNTAAGKFITSPSGRIKGCPKAAFIGLCESGDLRGIVGTRQSNSKNYKYAKFASKEWKKDNGVSKKEMWNRVQRKFAVTASHQGQLDVIIGIYDFLN